MALSLVPIYTGCSGTRTIRNNNYLIRLYNNYWETKILAIERWSGFFKNKNAFVLQFHVKLSHHTKSTRKEEHKCKKIVSQK